ncbi:hypothetical protein AA106555_1118 [Neokomagataea thailandica NBRC 106555]|uniref:DUF2987 domain-containing protein n=2 Tax=Neokomagataea TaxID=1223423 RepID=A0A4Y6V7G0_9PROT|nr:MULTISPECIES: DUF2987 domain-containing protein [Neokomagataea]QDH24265.1 DUF2987 domain-containing protein [Neokomagataea tanensis]GBR52990.1 hypothetical protein AA106555_1118 [Neokomagataea thailandica NBRC 106555]
MRKIYAILFLGFLIVQPLWADETIEVAGRRVHKVADYKRLIRVSDRFQKFPERARHGLSLVFVGETEPDHGLPSTAGLVVHTMRGDIPLYRGNDPDLHVPMDDALRLENPPVLQTSAEDKTVVNQIFLQVAAPDPTRFTGEDARHWLEQVNACVEDITGFVLAVFMPDAHRMQLAVAPSSRLEVTEGGTTRLLVDNGGATSYLYNFRPQDFSEDAVFHASKPLVWVRVLAPGNPKVRFVQEKEAH